MTEIIVDIGIARAKPMLPAKVRTISTVIISLLITSEKVTNGGWPKPNINNRGKLAPA